ncbi:MAG: ABC transporter ATP-binding protein [Phycisphaerales bacterium]
MPLIGTHLSFAYPKSSRVLDQVNCSIEQGAITAIVGPNGAGKSTLLRILAGLTNPDDGSVQLSQQPIQQMTAKHRAHHLAYIAQRSSLAFDFDTRLVVSFGRLSLRNDPAAIDRALARFDLTDLASKPMGTLSVGQQQRVSLARAWAQLDGLSDAYLLADEPTSAMDPKHQLEAMSSFQELAQRGIGVALVAHDLSLASRYADRVILLNTQGSIEAQGTTTEVLNPENLSRIFETPFVSGNIHGHPVLLPLTTTTQT